MIRGRTKRCLTIADDAVASITQTAHAARRGSVAPAENPFTDGSSAAVSLFEKEIKRLNTRIQDLLECNNAYLQRARDAEAKLKELK